MCIFMGKESWGLTRYSLYLTVNWEPLIILGYLKNILLRDIFLRDLHSVRRNNTEGPCMFSLSSPQWNPLCNFSTISPPGNRHWCSFPDLFRFHQFRRHSLVCVCESSSVWLSVCVCLMTITVKTQRTISSLGPLRCLYSHSHFPPPATPV